MVAHASAAQAAAFGVLSLPASGNASLPKAARTALQVFAADGANPALTREVVATAGVAHVIPGNGYICLQARSADQHSGGMECLTTADALAGKGAMYTGSSDDSGRVFLAGLVPDGVGAVTVTLTGGSTQAVPVTSNVYMQVLSKLPVSVGFDGSSGSVVVRLGS